MFIEIAGGSIAGADHSKPGQPGYTNNHDSFSWKQNDDLVVAVVTDGCGSGKHSEVGSKVANAIFVKTLFDELNQITQLGCTIDCNEQFWKRIQTRVVAKLTVLVESMGDSISRTVNDYFLFTCVGAIITPDMTYIFSLGDGMYVLNDEVHELGPFPNNAPPYLMYNLTGSSLFDDSPELLNFQVNQQIPSDDVQTLLLGSDGMLDFINVAESNIPGQLQLVGEVNQFWEQDKFFSNPDMVRRRLAMVNKEIVTGAKIAPGLLNDDTTCIVIRQP